MQKLVDLFSSREAQVRDMLSKIETGDVLDVVESELLNAIDIDGEYVHYSTPRQVQMVNRMIDVNLQALNTARIQLNAINQQQLRGTHSTSSNAENVLRQSLVAAGSSILGFVAKPLPVGIVLSISLALFERFIPPLTQQNLQDTKVSTPYGVTPNIDVIIITLYDIFGAIDQAVESQFTSIQTPSVEQSSLVQFPDVVDFMYDLLTDISIEGDLLPQLISKRLRLIPQILNTHMIEVVNYDKDKHDDLASFFEFEPTDSLKQGEYITERPALVQDKQTLKLGLVIHG